MAYTGIDKEIYDSGTHFRPLQEYTQQQWTPPEIMGQNTNAGITNTQAAGSYMGYPSYEAWLLAQGGGGGNGGGNEIEEDTFSMGMSPGAMGGKLPGFGNWAKRTAGTLGHAYSKLPTPGNLIRKGIRHWQTKRAEKEAEEQRIKEIEVSQRSQANAIAAGGGQPQSGITANTTRAQAAGMGGGSRQATSAGSTNSGRTDGGWGWAQGGRIGMAKGKIPLPRAKTKMGFLDKLFSGIGGLSAVINHPNLRRSIQGTTPSGQRAAAAMLRKYGKWGARGMGLLNPWTAVPYALMAGAQYGVGKAFDPYRDETGKIGAEGHAQLASAARAREALMAQRNAARQNRRAGGVAGLL